MKSLTSISLILLAFSLAAQAQEDEKATTISISTGVVGGSYYDVKNGYKMDKYGAERLSPTGYSFTGILESDKIGSIYLRKLSVSRKEDGTNLGSHTLFTYDSTKLGLLEKPNMNLFLKGKVLHYSQKDHFIYFQVDENHNPDLDQNLELGPHARVDQHQTYLAPEVGVCFDKSVELNHFDLEGFVEATVAPLALLNYKTQLTTGNLAGLNKTGNVLAAGGQITLEGMAKYKDRYYFKVRVQQSYHAGFASDKPSVANRIGHYELGYNVNKNLAVNVSAENNEMMFVDKDRQAIDVYNIVAVGLKYKIPVKKKMLLTQP